MMKKIIYIANARIPTEKAHGIQIVKMSEQLTQVLGAANFLLLLPRRIQPKTINEYQSLTRDYGTTIKIPLKKLPVVDLLLWSDNLPRPIQEVCFYLETISFAVTSFLYSLKNLPNASIYTRDFYLLPILCLLPNPVYFEAHHYPQTLLAKMLYKHIFPRLAGVVTITPFFKEFYDKDGFNYKKLLVSPDATDPGFFQKVDKKTTINLKAKFKLSGKIVIGYIGRIVGLGEDKGVGTLLQAFQKLRLKNVVLFIVGGYPQDIKSLVGNEGQNISKVMFTGELPYRLMPDYFSLIDIGVIPVPDKPYFRYFVSPLKVYDYLAAGIPIIASDLPSLKSIISDKNGMFFQPENVAELSRCLRDLASNPLKRKQLRLENRNFVKNLTWKNRAIEIVKFINS